MTWMLLWACSSAPQETQEPPHPRPAVQGRRSFHLEPSFQLVDPSGPSQNVLIISLDTVWADRLGVYGGPAETPVLGALAAQGALFESAMTQFPETCLSHWSMLTGVLPEVHGNAPAHGGSRYLGPTLAELARHAGYATAGFIGGVTLQDSACGLGRGFDVYDDQFALDPSDMRRPGAEVTRAAKAWIEDREGPWLAFVHYFDAHFPYTPAPPWDTRYDPTYEGELTGTDQDLRPFRDGGKTPTSRDLEHVLALYDGELSELDALIAPVIAAAGEDTVVVVTSDHGESFGHDYYFNHREGLWDQVLHVPWILRGPGVAPGTVIPQQVGLVDLTPTVAHLAGLPTDARMQGQNRSPELGGDGEGESVHYALTDPWMPKPQFSARTSATKVIWRADRHLVYDLRTDPAEKTSTSSIPSDLASARDTYRKLVDSLGGHQGSPPQQDRFISPEEAARLEALGYRDPSRPPPEEVAPP